MIELIDALTARGVECRVVVPEAGYVTLALEDRAVPYIIYRYWPWARESPLSRWSRVLKKPPVHLLRGIRLARRILGWRCDVVVSNTLTICEGALAARILGLPHITYAREFGDLDHGLHFEWGPRLSMRILSLLSTRIVFNSAALARHYRQQVAPARARVLYNAVSVSAAGEPAGRSRPAAMFFCVLVGSLIPGKGHQDAIRAVAELTRRGVPLSLKIVGSGPAAYRRWLQELIDSLGVAACVEMVGHAPDAEVFLREADVALTCSRMEAFGRVTIEAMKLGTPVIGTRSGGTIELIQDGFNGFLYTPGDAQELADKIGQLERNPEGARLMAERARRFASDTFTLDRLGDEFLDLLREVTNARGHRWSCLQVHSGAATLSRAIRAIGTPLLRWLNPRHAGGPVGRRSHILVARPRLVAAYFTSAYRVDSEAHNCF